MSCLLFNFLWLMTFRSWLGIRAFCVINHCTYYITAILYSLYGEIFSSWTRVANKTLDGLRLSVGDRLLTANLLALASAEISLQILTILINIASFLALLVIPTLFCFLSEHFCVIFHTFQFLFLLSAYIPSFLCACM